MATPESLEVKSLRALAAHIGARVTSTTGGEHSATSYHFAAGTGGDGLAIDLAELSGPSALTPGLKRIATEVARLIGPQCAELIYATGPNYRNGQPYRWYGPVTLWAHRNHIHVAVRRGFRWTAPVTAPEVRPMFSPPHVLEPIVASLAAPGGGFWLLAVSGAVYAYEGAWFPREGAAKGTDYFKGRTAARLEVHESGGFTIVATSGERYMYPKS